MSECVCVCVCVCVFLCIGFQACCIVYVFGSLTGDYEENIANHLPGNKSSISSQFCHMQWFDIESPSG